MCLTGPPHHLATVAVNRPETLVRLRLWQALLTSDKPALSEVSGTALTSVYPGRRHAGEASVSAMGLEQSNRRSNKRANHQGYHL